MEEACRARRGFWQAPSNARSCGFWRARPIGRKPIVRELSCCRWRAGPASGSPRRLACARTACGIGDGFSAARGLRARKAAGPAAAKEQAALSVIEQVLAPEIADRSNWTLPRLQDEIERRTGERISKSRLSVVLQKILCGWTVA